MRHPKLGRDEIMFVVDIERFKALCALYFLNTIQPEELEELKAALNSGETELRKIFNQTKKTVKESPVSGRFIDTYIDDAESYVEESKLKDVWNYSFVRLFLSYWFSKIKIKLVLAISFILLASLIILSFFTLHLESEVKNMRVDMAVQNFELNKKENLLAILQLRDVVVVDLKRQTIDSESYGRVVWSPSTQKAILQVTGLPPTGRGMAYQLWLVKDDEYINKGTFYLNNSKPENQINIGNISVPKNASNYSFFITLEKEDNNTKPIGAVYLMGKIEKF